MTLPLTDSTPLATEGLQSTIKRLTDESTSCVVFTSSEGCRLIEDKPPGIRVFSDIFMRRYNYENGNYVEVPFGPGYPDAAFEELLVLPYTDRVLEKGYRIIWKRDQP